MASLGSPEPPGSGGTGTEICLQLSLTAQASSTNGGVTPRASPRWCLHLCLPGILPAQRLGLKEACVPHSR